MRARLRQRRPDLLVCAVPADFMDVVALPTEVPSLPRLGFFPGSTIGNLDPPEARRFLQRARGALGRSVMVPGGCRSAQGSGDPAAGLRRCAGRHRGVQSQPAGAAESRGRRRFRSGSLRASRRLERRREPDRDAPGQSARPAGARRRPGDPLRARRDDPHREQLQVCAGAIRRVGRAGRMAQRGAVDRSGAACSHCICWSRGEDRNGPPGDGFVAYAPRQ